MKHDWQFQSYAVDYVCSRCGLHAKNRLEWYNDRIPTQEDLKDSRLQGTDCVIEEDSTTYSINCGYAERQEVDRSASSSCNENEVIIGTIEERVF